MNTVTTTDATLTVEPQGLDKLWSLTRKLEFPADHVRGATLDPGANHEPKGIRAPGLAIPGKWSGTFHRDGEKSFWNVSGPDATVVVELTGEDFDRLYLTVDDPRAVVDSINAMAKG
jgi:hypothetical protein